MKPAEYRAMSDDQLELSLREVYKNLFHLRFQSATDRLETPSEIRKAKSDAARILTIKRERELVALKAAAATTAPAPLPNTNPAALPAVGSTPAPKKA